MGQLGVLGGSLVIAVVVALVVGRYLPSIPYASRLMLAPPEEGGELVADTGEANDLRFAALLGAIGTAATPLRPAGTVRIGDDYLDVVAEGSYVEAGSRVQVVEVEAHRIVVKEV
jgi:membrane-bound serine protease (ClpP class)